MKVKDLIKQPEGRRLEFKEQLPKTADLTKTIVAFANDAGGELFVGIRNEPREIVGIPKDELFQVEEQISNLIFDHCYPAIIPEISFHGDDEKRFIRVKIYRGSQLPYYIKSKGKLEGTFIRIGSSNRKADLEILSELERQKRNISFDSEPILEYPIDHWNIESFKHFYQTNTGELLDEQSLRKLGLLKIYQGNWYPTNTYILFSEKQERLIYFPYSKIEFARFKGTTADVFIDQKTIDDHIVAQAEATYEFVLRHINKGALVKGVYTSSRWEYPIVDIRETIRNAIAHRDYSLTGKDIKVAIYDDMVEITSPGKLMPSIDFTEMEARQSDIRNKTIAPILKLLGIIDQWGNGLKQIVDELKDYPEIEFRWFEIGMQFQVQFIKIGKIPQPDPQPELQSHLQPELNEQLELQLELQLESENASLYTQVLNLLISGEASKKQISRGLNQKVITGHLNKVVNKLVADLLVKRTLEDIPTSSKQKYFITQKGLLFLKMIQKPE